MTVALSPTGVYGKAASGDGFGVFAEADGRVPADVVVAAAEWLRVFLGTSNVVVVVACAVQRRWWILRAEEDPLTDSAGRPLGFVSIGGLPTNTPADALPALLLHAAQQPITRDVPLRAIPCTRQPAARSAAAADAVLARVAGCSLVAVPRVDEAAAVLAATGPVFRWVGFLPDQLPSTPPVGPGLAVSRQPTEVPPQVSEVVSRVGPEAVFATSPGRLSGLFQTAPERLRAFRAVVGELDSRGGTWVGREAAEWMAQSKTGRAAALAGLMAEDLSDWLGSASARPEDLSALAPRLRPEHRPAIRGLLAGHPAAATLYLCHVPDDPAGAIELLPPAARQTWDDLADEGLAVPPEDEVAALLGTAAPLIAAGAMTLAQLARAATASESARVPLLAALDRAGFPEGVARGLLVGGSIQLTSLPPAIRPGASWLMPFPAALWLEAGRSFTGDAGWREWWYDGLSVFVESGRLDRAAVLAAGLAGRDARVLGLGGGAPSLTAFATAGQGLELPPRDGAWPSEADPLLAEAVTSGSLFARLRDPATDALLGWLAGRGGGTGVFAEVARVRADLAGAGPVPGPWVARLARALPRHLVLQQLGAWGARPGPDRAGPVSALLGSDVLAPGEADWLRALLLTADPLPAAPPWSVLDLIGLLPVLDPARDVVRAVLARPAREKGEEELLGRVLPRLGSAAPPGAFPDGACVVRPDWVAALAALPGWDWAAGPQAAVARLVEQARAVSDRWDGVLPEPVRAAVAGLARANGRTDDAHRR